MLFTRFTLEKSCSLAIKLFKIMWMFFEFYTSHVVRIMYNFVFLIKIANQDRCVIAQSIFTEETSKLHKTFQQF